MTSPCQQVNVNTLDLYQTEAPVTCRFSLLEQGDSLWVHAILNFKEPVEDSSLWIKFSRIYVDQIKTDSNLVALDRNNPSIVKWGFTPQTIPDLFTLRLNWKARTWTFQEHFPMNAFHPTGGLSLWQSTVPVDSRWVLLGDSILISTPQDETVFAFYYDHEFDPGRPPMSLRPGKGSGSLEIDTVLARSSNRYFIPDRPGLYFFQIDSSTNEGSALYVPENNFPQPQKINELTEPLIYITTKGEYQKIKLDLTSKQALDKFWLSTLGSAGKARTAIKSFYDNVKVSNVLFTSYKEGWKTDRGMIYTIMGPPLSVIKDHLTETWSYRDVNNEEVTFVFRKIKNIFSNNHYELLRDKSYDRPWFLAIDRWREGRKK